MHRVNRHVHIETLKISAAIFKPHMSLSSSKTHFFNLKKVLFVECTMLNVCVMCLF